MNSNNQLRRVICLFVLCSISLSTALFAAIPYRISVVGDSISLGAADGNWDVPYEFGFRGGLYTRLINSGRSVQFVGNSPEPWNGVFGLPKNVPNPDLRN